MKTKKQSFIYIVTILLLLDGCKPGIRPEIAMLADSIAGAGVVHKGLIGAFPSSYTSDQFLRFVSLADNSTTSELQQLSNHANSIVRYYALSALSYREDENVLFMLADHLTDTAEIKSLGFDIMTRAPLSSIVAREFMERYFKKMPLNKLNYQKVRSLALDPIVPSALVMLARFKKPQDKEMLKQRIWELIFMLKVLPNDASPYYPLYGLAAIRDYPDSIFYPILKECADSMIVGRKIPRNMLFQAIVQYQTDSSLTLLRRAFDYSNQQDDYRAQADLAVALIKYPDHIFQHEFADKVKLNFKTVAMWYRWSKEEL